MRTHRQRVVFVFIIIFYCVFWLRDFTWYSAIKVRELAAMAGQSRDVQLQVLHPTGEMADLLKLRDLLRVEYPNRNPVVVAPIRDGELPQGHNASILRSILHPIPIISDSFQLNQADFLVVIVASASASESAEQICHKNERGCSCWQNKTSEQEVLCWHMPTP